MREVPPQGGSTTILQKLRRWVANEESNFEAEHFEGWEVKVGVGGGRVEVRLSRKKGLVKSIGTHILHL